MTPPVAMSLIQSAPYLMSRRTTWAMSSTVSATFRRGEVHVGRKGSAVTVASGKRDTATGGGDAGAEDDSALDGIAQGELRIVGGAFARVTERSKSVIEP